MIKHLLEVPLLGIGAFIEGLHTTSIIIVSLLMPHELAGMVFGAIGVKLLNFLTEAGLLKLKNQKTRKGLKAVSILISIGLTIAFSFLNFHNNQITVRDLQEGGLLFIMIGTSFVIMEYSLHVISEIIISYPVRKKGTKEINVQENKFWFTLFRWTLFLLVFLGSIALFAFVVK